MHKRIFNSKCEQNGLDLAQKIQRYDTRGFIVFITTHSEMSAMTFAYRVEAMDFIIKAKLKVSDRFEGKTHYTFQ